MVPQTGVAVVLLTNGGNAATLYADLVGHVLSELASVRLPELPTPAAEPASIDVRRYLGTYSCDVADVTVSQDDEGRVWMDEVPKGIAIEFGDTPQRTELIGYGEDTLIALHPDRGMHRVYAFLEGDRDHAAYLHTGRALVRSPG
jgi:hypothetical protein